MRELNQGTQSTLAIWGRCVYLFMMTNLAYCFYSEYVERIIYAVGRGCRVVKCEIIRCKLSSYIKLISSLARTLN